MLALSRLRDLLLAVAASLGLLLATALLLLVGHIARRPHRLGVTPDPHPAPVTATIVIAEQSGGTRLRECLDSVAEAIRQNGAAHQAIVVGSKGVDASETRVYKHAGVSFLAAPCKDPAQRWKLGIEAATNNVVVLLTDDVVADPGFLRPLLACFEDPAVFAAAARVDPADPGADPPATGKTRGEIHNGSPRFWHALPVPGGEATQPILWAPRGRSAYRRDLFLEFGGFDPLFASAELADAGLGFRAWKLGWRVYLESGSVLRLVSPALTEAPPSPDLTERDCILFSWGSLSSAGNLTGHAVTLAIRLLEDAARGQLNLRPLRYALGCLPQLLARRRAPSVPVELTDEEVFRISSHSYFLERHKETRGRGSGGTGRHEDRETWRPGDTESENPTLSTQNLELRTQNSELRTPLRLLLVCPQLPYPPTHGAAVRMWNLLKTLATRHQVDLLSFSEPGMEAEDLAASQAELRRHCGRIRTVERRPPPCRPSLTDRTIHVEIFDCPEMREALLDMVESGRYDVVQFDKTEMGQYLLPPPAPVQVLIEHVVFYHAYRRQFLKPGRDAPATWIDYLRLRRYELGVCRKAGGIITMSRVDSEFLRSRLPSHPCIVEVPNGVDTAFYRFAPAPAEGHDLLFVGNFDHSPNVDGVRFFLREVFPRVKAAIQDVRLLIVGPGPYSTVPEVAAEPAAVPTGLVPDTRPYLEGCSVMVAPILAGSGTRLKILEAFSAGIPVVSTAIGAEGLDAVSETHLLIADEPAAFAAQVIRLLGDRPLRLQLRANARHLVESRYDWATVGERQEAVYRALHQG